MSAVADTNEQDEDEQALRRAEAVDAEGVTGAWVQMVAGRQEIASACAGLERVGAEPKFVLQIMGGDFLVVARLGA